MFSMLYNFQCLIRSCTRNDDCACGDFPSKDSKYMQETEQCDCEEDGTDVDQRIPVEDMLSRTRGNVFRTPPATPNCNNVAMNCGDDTYRYMF